MNLSGTFPTFLMIYLLAGCSALKTTPQPPPTPTNQAQEVTRAQTFGLEKMAAVSALVRGSPMDVEAEIQRKANASGARYYMIIMNSDTVTPGQWYSQAILYR